MTRTLRTLASLGLTAALLALAGCSTRQLYDTVAATTAQDCNPIVNAEERARCRKKVEMSYDQYERERQKAQSK
ncbi:MAG: hypothetical protein RL227_1791 [Pseudomonadota bacterium]